MNVPDDMAAALRQLGVGSNLPEVQKLYLPLTAAQRTDGVRQHADLPYGEHQRQMLDVYQPTEPGDQLRPVLVCVHGGGFIRGDKSNRANAGWYFARHGIVTVVPNYRLAPDGRWPSGPQDVVAVVQWIRQHASEFGADPGRIVLMGESAGAAHVAAATLMTRFHPPGGLGIRGAILQSGPYDARLEGLSRRQFGIETPDPRNEAYFGAGPADWAAGSIVDHIDAAPLPLSIGWAERDHLQMQIQAGELFARLVRDHGFSPELLFVRDHNHFSQTVSLNTGDESVGAPVRDFIARHAAVSAVLPSPTTDEKGGAVTTASG